MGPVYLIALVGVVVGTAAALDVKYGWTGRYRTDGPKHYHGSPHISATRERAASDLIDALRREYGTTAKEWLRARRRSMAVPPAWEHLQVIRRAVILDGPTREVPVIGVPA